MRALVTGSTGFVGRWLVEELRRSGHEVAECPGRAALDIEDAAGLGRAILAESPDAIVHLAAMAFAPDASRASDEALRVNRGGTGALFTAAAEAGSRAPVLVVSSGDVYGTPNPTDLPLTEDAPVRATTPYGLSKVAQEHAALDGAARAGVTLGLSRSFNHTGPGQRAEFVAPALARRVLAAKRSGDPRILVGNVDVRRDFTDVRDVARAYRLLLEHLLAERPVEPVIVNVASGRSISIRELVAMIGQAVGVEPELVVDPALVRSEDPREIVGDASRLRALTGWAPEIPLERTIADLVASLEAR